MPIVIIGVKKINKGKIRRKILRRRMGCLDYGF